MPQPLIQRIHLDLSQSRRAYLKHRARLESLSEAGEEAAESMDGIGTESSAAAEGLDEMGDAAKRTGKSSGAAAEAVDEVGDAAETAGKKSGKATGKLKSLALRISDATDSGLGFVTMVSGSLIAALASAAAYFGGTSAAAVTFESAMIDVRKTTGLVGEDLDNLGDTLLEIAGRVGVGRREMAEIAATAGQLGIEGTESIATFSETVAKMAQATDLSADEASSGLARVANAFNIPIEKANELGSVLNELSNNSTALSSDLVQSLSQGVAATGREIGVTVDEAAALSAALIDAGVSARRAGTSLRNIFARISANAEKAAEQMGITEDQFRQMISEDAVGALRAYIEALRQMPAQRRAPAAADIFGDRAGANVAALASNIRQLNPLLEMANKQISEGTSLNREFRLSLDAVSRQASLLWSKFTGWATEAGEEFLPMLEGTLRMLNRWARGAEETGRAIEEVRAQMQDTSALRAAAERYNDLAGKEELSAQQARTLKRATDQLTDAFPELIKRVSGATGEVQLYGEAVERVAKRQDRASQLTEAAYARDLVEQFNEARSTIEAVEDRTNRLGDLLEKGYTFNIDFTSGPTRLRITDQLEEMGRVSGEQEKKMQRLIEVVQKYYQTDGKFDRSKLREVLSKTLMPTEQITETLDALEKQLEQTTQGVRDYKSEVEGMQDLELPGAPQGITAGDLERDGAPTGDTLTEEQQQAIADAKEALDAYARSAELAAASTDEVKQALEDVHDAQADIRELEGIAETLGQDAVADEMEAAKQRLRLAQARVGQEKALKMWIDINAQAINDAISGQGGLNAVMEGIDTPETLNQLEIFSDRFAKYQKRVSELRAELASGEKDAEEFGRALAEATQASLQQLKPLLRGLVAEGDLTKEQMDKVVKAINEVEGNAEDAKGETSNLGSTLQDVARAGRGVLQLADTFDTLDESVRRVAESTLSAMDNMGRLIEMREAASAVTNDQGETVAKAGTWEALFKGSGGAAAAIPAIGAVAGVASAISSTIKANNKAEERRRAKLEELSDSLAENARAVEENTKALFEQARVASGMSQSELDRAQQLMSGMRSGQGDLQRQASEFSDITGIDLESITGPVEDALSQIQGMEGDKETTRTWVLGDLIGQDLGENLSQADMNKVIRELLFGDISQERKQSILDVLGLEDIDLSALEDLENLPDELQKQLGAFGDSVAGATEKMRYMEEQGLTGALDAFINKLLSLDLSGAGITEEGKSNEITKSLRSLLEEYQAEDTSEERRKEIRRIIAEAEVAGEFAYGSLTPDEITQILNGLREGGGEGGAATAEDQWSRSQSISRTISEFQANELIALANEQVVILRRMLAAIAGEDALEGLGASYSAHDIGSGKPLPVDVVRLSAEARANLDRLSTPPATPTPSPPPSGGSPGGPAMTHGGGSGNGNTFHLHVDTYGQDPEEFGRVVSQALERYTSHKRNTY